MNLFQILDIDYCSDPLIKAVVSIAKTIFTLIQWAIPLVLIVLCTIDMFKAMASGDEKKTKETQSKCIKRLIYAIVAFLVPFIINLVFGFADRLLDRKNDQYGDTAQNSFQTFLSCWNGNGTEDSGDTDDGTEDSGDTDATYICVGENDGSTYTVGLPDRDSCTSQGFKWVKK